MRQERNGEKGRSIGGGRVGKERGGEREEEETRRISATVNKLPLHPVAPSGVHFVDYIAELAQ